MCGAKRRVSNRSKKRERESNKHNSKQEAVLVARKKRVVDCYVANWCVWLHVFVKKRQRFDDILQSRHKERYCRKCTARFVQRVLHTRLHVQCVQRLQCVALPGNTGIGRQRKAKTRCGLEVMEFVLLCGERIERLYLGL